MAMDGDEPSRASGSARRWLVRLVFLLVLVAALIGALPYLVANTSLRQQVVPNLLPEFSGTASIGSAQLGWFSTIELGDVRLNDQQGELLVDAGRISCDRTLLDLLRSGADGVTIRVERPVVDLVVRDDGSNWEDALQSILAKGESGGDSPSLTVAVTDGEIRLYDAERKLAGTFSEWQMEGLSRPSEPVPVAVKTSASIAREDLAAGRLEATLKLLPPVGDGEGVDGTAGDITIQGQSVVIDALSPLLNRFAPGSKIRGRTTCDANVGWDASGIRIAGKVAGKNLQLDSADWLGTDVIALEQVDADLQLALNDKSLQVAHCRLNSDVATLAMSGTLHLDETAPAGLATLFGHEDYRAEGQVDLAKLAAQLPGILRVRDDAHLTSGQVSFSVDSTVEDARRRWNANVSTSRLEAMAGGRPISWQRPVAIQLAATERADGQIVGQLRCDSEYLTVVVDGSATEATVDATGDFTRLVADLRPLVDLNDLQLAGQFKLSINGRRTANEQFDANGHMLVQQFEFSMPGQRPLREDRMTIALEATGALVEREVSELRTAALRMNSAGDRLEISLREPVSAPAASQRWPVAIGATGDLATWLPRIQTWLPLEGWELRGQMDLTADTTLAESELTVATAKIKIDRFRAASAGRVIEQEVVQVTTSGTWDRVKNAISSRLTTVQSPAVDLRAENLAAQLSGGDEGTSPSATGDIVLRGDLGTLQAWSADPQSPPSSLLRGQLDGRVQLDSRGGVTTANCAMAVRDFQVLSRAVPPPLNVARGAATMARPIGQQQRWEPIWTEQQLVLSGQGRYTPAADRVDIDKLAVDSKALQMAKTTGSFTQLSTAPAADVSGQLQYDLAVMSNLFSAYLGENVRLAGAGRRPFRFRGPLPLGSEDPSRAAAQWWSSVTADAAIGWDSFEVYGMNGGKAELQATMQRGVVQFQPLDLSFNQGRLRTTPQIRLDTDPNMLVLSSDTMVDRAQLTEQLCSSWLQYVAPALSNATRAQGQFSVRVPKSAVPLTAPERSEIAGTLTIHAAQVRPGPLTAQLVSLASQVDSIIKRRPAGGLAGGSTALNIAQQDVPFRVTEGRVHHENFQIEVGDVLVRTSGYVGLDNTLGMVAEIPIRDKWVEKDRILSGLKGQTLKIPVRGTLGQPKLDRRAVTDLGKQMLGGAAQGLLKDQLDKQLKKGLEGLFR